MPLIRYLPAMAIGCIMWAFLYGTVGTAGVEAFALVWERDHTLALELEEHGYAPLTGSAR